MKQKDGNITNDRQEILNVCADFYKELYSSKSSESKPNIISPDQSAIPQVTVREVEMAIKEMKDNKAPGTDDITSDIIKILFYFITSSLAWGYPISDNTVFHGCPGVKQNTSKS